MCDDDFFDKIDTKKISDTINKIVSIYRKCNGEPKIKPYLKCPICDKETNSYACAYGYNDHVSFKCNHCGFMFMQ